MKNQYWSILIIRKSENRQYWQYCPKILRSILRQYWRNTVDSYDNNDQYWSLENQYWFIAAKLVPVADTGSIPVWKHRWNVPEGVWVKQKYKMQYYNELKYFREAGTLLVRHLTHINPTTLNVRIFWWNFVSWALRH